MGKLKNMVIEICEMYDYDRMEIEEIANHTGLSEDQVLEVLFEYSMNFVDF